LNDFYLTNSFDRYYNYEPDLGENSPLEYNRVDHILILGNCNIPLDDVTLNYAEIPSKYGYTTESAVLFACKKSDCIISTKGSFLAATAAKFENKENCIRFIELVNQLREENQKESKH
jgi:hypothetical protein